MEREKGTDGYNLGRISIRKDRIKKREKLKLREFRYSYERLAKKFGKRFVKTALKYFNGMVLARALFPNKKAKYVQYRLAFEFITGKEDYYEPIEPSSRHLSFKIKYFLKGNSRSYLVQRLIMLRAFDYEPIPEELYQYYKKNILLIDKKDVEILNRMKMRNRIELFQVQAYHTTKPTYLRDFRARLSISRKFINNLFLAGR